MKRMAKLIDRLLKKAKILGLNMLRGLFSCNDDGFIQALGLDPVKYEVGADESGEMLYDADKALNDSCKLVDWDEE